MQVKLFILKLTLQQMYVILQFIIEAVVGGKQGSIAIDNIIVYSSESGPCPAERECTFQGSLCGLLPLPSANFSWIRITGKSQPANSSGPATDHTLGTEQGVQLLEIVSVSQSAMNYSNHIRTTWRSYLLFVSFVNKSQSHQHIGVCQVTHWMFALMLCSSEQGN